MFLGCGLDDCVGTADAWFQMFEHRNGPPGTPPILGLPDNVGHGVLGVYPVRNDWPKTPNLQQIVEGVRALRSERGWSRTHTKARPSP